MLKKPIILSLLFLLITIFVGFIFRALFILLKIESPVFYTYQAFAMMTSAIVLSAIYTKIIKETLSKNQKTRIFLYSSIVIILFFLVECTVHTGFLHKKPPCLILGYINISLAFINYVLYCSCIYPALGLGGKVINPELDTEKNKLKDVLIIIFFIILSFGFIKISPSLIVAPVMNYFGYEKRPPIVIKQFEDKTSISGTDFIHTTNYANPKLGYYYYISKKIMKNKAQKTPFLIMVPGRDGNGQDIVTKQFKDFAKQNGFVIIAPSFIEDTKNWDKRTSYQYPAAWSGKALDSILHDFTTKQKISSNGIYMYGFGAGAQFSERYSLLHPNYIIACVIHNPGSLTLPTSFQKTKFFISVGTREENFRKELAKNFYAQAKKLGISVQYKQYNCGHIIPNEQRKDSIEFFKQVKHSHR